MKCPNCDVELDLAVTCSTRVLRWVRSCDGCSYEKVEIEYPKLDWLVWETLVLKNNNPNADFVGTLLGKLIK